MRATIINPSYERDYEYYHLGTAAIASTIDASQRHQADVVDFSFVWKKWADHLRRHLEEFKPQVVGISTASPRMPQALHIARACKEMLPGVQVVMGGHHASLDTPGTARQDCVDYVVVGEGEGTILGLLDILEDGGDADRLAALPSLAFQRGDEVIEAPLGPLPKGTVLDALPFNNWRLWEQHPRAIYHCGFLPIIGVRGCPYKCSFCSSPVLAERLRGTGPFVRQKDAERVAHEVAWQWERHGPQGLRYMMFYDQNFLMYTNWLKTFTAEYRRLGLHEKLPFSAYSRVDHLTEERLELARAAGCVQLRLGIEAGDPEVRNELLKKDLNQEMLHEKLELVRRSGIKTLGYFLIGSPGETPAQASKSFKLARREGLDRAAFFFFTPLHELPLQKDIEVDYLHRDQASGFAMADDLTQQGSGFSKLRLLFLFYRANGWFVLKTALRQVRARGLGFIAGFFTYWWGARSDGFDLQQTIAQYIYYKDDAFLH